MQPSSNASTINVLLLGETGVGKSTFINSLANYTRHKTFEDATKVKPIMLIPTQIIVFDEGAQNDRTLNIGSDRNEKQSVGVSATQNVKTYLFPVEGANSIMQLIDTPGIGDTRGPDKDDENCQGILEFLNQLDKLHAICLLMKPSNDRNTVLFSYCVRRLLSQLHKSACDNIVFLFTNTKGSDYRPGSTKAILKKMRDEIEREPPFVKIPILDDNIFCFDNESFKHLLAMDYGIKLNQRILSSCKTSWEVSCDEVRRFVRYVCKLTPHEVKQTVSVNKVRDLILQLSKPMSDICQLVQEKLLNWKMKEEESANSEQSIEELKKNLMKPGVDLEIVHLDKPATVCTNLGCVAIVKVGSITKTSYKTRCHDPCLLGFITYDTIGHWSLVTCSEMTIDFFPTCKRCSCSYKKHMTIYYDTKLVEKQMIDEEINKILFCEEFQRDTLKAVMEKISKEKEELAKELEFISSCAAKFAYYLENHALTSSYDYFREYLHLALERQRSLGQNANMLAVANLTDMLNKHEKLIEMLKNKGSAAIDEEVNEVTIQRDAEKLFSLKHAGPKLKEIFDARAACAKKSSTEGLKQIITEMIPNWFLN